MDFLTTNPTNQPLYLWHGSNGYCISPIPNRITNKDITKHSKSKQKGPNIRPRYNPDKKDKKSPSQCRHISFPPSRSQENTQANPPLTQPNDSRVFCREKHGKKWRVMYPTKQQQHQSVNSRPKHAFQNKSPRSLYIMAVGPDGQIFPYPKDQKTRYHVGKR